MHDACQPCPSVKEQGSFLPGKRFCTFLMFRQPLILQDSVANGGESSSDSHEQPLLVAASTHLNRSTWQQRTFLAISKRILQNRVTPRAQPLKIADGLKEACQVGQLNENIKSVLPREPRESSRREPLEAPKRQV